MPCHALVGRAHGPLRAFMAMLTGAARCVQGSDPGSKGFFILGPQVVSLGGSAGPCPTMRTSVGGGLLTRIPEPGLRHCPGAPARAISVDTMMIRPRQRTAEKQRLVFFEKLTLPYRFYHTNESNTARHTHLKTQLPAVCKIIAIFGVSCQYTLCPDLYQEKRFNCLF